MRIDILTLFPDTLGDVLSESILGRAQERGYISIEAHQIRDYTANKQNQVDDYPYGGGRGAIMQADPLYRCWEAVCDEAGGEVHTVYLSPCGHTFRQADAIRLSKLDNLILVCGHYEGIDQRFIDECVDEEISLGDFVLTGGEIPAMAVADCLFRMEEGGLPEESCRTPSALRRNPTGTDCWNIPSIPGPPCGMTGPCRRSCSPAITKRCVNGGGSRRFAAPGRGGRTCMHSWIYRRSRTRSC